MTFEKRPAQEKIKIFLRSYDIVCLVFITAACLIVFGMKSEQLGFYGDDTGFLILSKISWQEILTFMTIYLPGRNLHIFWQHLLFYLFGGNVDALPSLHWAQAAASTLVVVLVFCILRVVKFGSPAALAGATIFAFYPNHSEVQFWPSALPMNIASTGLALVSMLSALIAARWWRYAEAHHQATLLSISGISAALSSFTYEQPVPLLTITAGVCGALIISQDKKSWNRIIAWWAFISTVYVANIYMRLSDPGNGPGFGHVNLEHIGQQFSESIKMAFGSSLFQDFFGEPALSHFENNFMTAASISILGSLIFFWLSLGDTKKNEAFSSILLAFAGLSIVFVGYMTNYLWFLSTRHNYLPSIGIGVLFAAISALALAILGRAPEHIRLIGICLFSISLGFFLLISTNSVLASKDLWIQSFQARLRFYADLEKVGHLRPKDILVLNGFPRYLGNQVVFFGYEQPGATSLITKERIKLRTLLENFVPTRGGIFSKVEVAKFRDTEFNFLATENYVTATYNGIKGAKIEFASDRIVPLPKYVIHQAPKEGDVANSYQPSLATSFSLPAIEIGPDEVFAALPYLDEKALTDSSTNGLDVLALAKLPCERVCMGHFVLDSQLQRAGVTSLRIFAVSEFRQPRLLHKAEVKRIAE